MSGVPSNIPKNDEAPCRSSQIPPYGEMYSYHLQRDTRAGEKRIRRCCLCKFDTSEYQISRLDKVDIDIPSHSPRHLRLTDEAAAFTLQAMGTPQYNRMVFHPTHVPDRHYPGCAARPNSFAETLPPMTSLAPVPSPQNSTFECTSSTRKKAGIKSILNSNDSSDSNNLSVQSLARAPSIEIRKTIRRVKGNPLGAFPCPAKGCGKKFDRRYNLKVHSRKHTNENPYRCKVKDCPNLFKWRSSLAHHLKTRHPNFVDRSKGNGNASGTKYASTVPEPLPISTSPLSNNLPISAVEARTPSTSIHSSAYNNTSVRDHFAHLAGNHTEINVSMLPRLTPLDSQVEQKSPLEIEDIHGSRFLKIKTGQ